MKSYVKMEYVQKIQDIYAANIKQIAVTVKNY